MTTEPDDDAPDRSRARWLGGTAVLLAVPVFLVWWPGCRQYPAVTSRDALYQMQLLYAAANTKDPTRLAKVEAGVGKLTREGKLSPAEQEAFGTIIGQARAGDWAGAEQAAFRFAKDQVGVGHPDPDGDAGRDHRHPPKKR